MDIALKTGSTRGGENNIEKNGIDCWIDSNNIYTFRKYQLKLNVIEQIDR